MPVANLTIEELFNGDIASLFHLKGRRRGSIIDPDEATTTQGNVEWDMDDEHEGLALFATKTKKNEERETVVENVAENTEKLKKIEKEKELEAAEVISRMFAALSSDELRMQVPVLCNTYKYSCLYSYNSQIPSM